MKWQNFRNGKQICGGQKLEMGWGQGVGKSKVDVFKKQDLSIWAILLWWNCSILWLWWWIHKPTGDIMIYNQIHTQKWIQVKLRKSKQEECINIDILVMMLLYSFVKLYTEENCSKDTQNISVLFLTTTHKYNQLST